MASYIPALVLQKNDDVFISPVGSSKEIPTPDTGAYIDGDYWALPVNAGIKSGFTYLPYNPSNTVEATAPVPYAIAVSRVSSTKTSDVFWVVGTTAQYITAAGGGTALPTTIPNITLHTKVLIPVCQDVAFTNASGLYTVVLGLPTLGAGEKYYPFGYMDGVALATASSSGYSSVSALLSFLNTNWTNVGSPTTSSDNLTLIGTETSGVGIDVFCGDVFAINPSL